MTFPQALIDPAPRDDLQKLTFKVDGQSFSGTDLLRALELSWCRYTSAKRASCSASSPAQAQCVPTAFVVHHLLGGEIVRAKAATESHYFNLLGDGTVLDFTRSQSFGAEMWDILSRPISRGYIGDSGSSDRPHTLMQFPVGINHDTTSVYLYLMEIGDNVARFELLLSRVTAVLRLMARTVDGAYLPFLEPSVRSERWIRENRLAFVIDQPAPWGISPGHRLICPKRAVPTYFDLSADEVQAVHELLLASRDEIDRDLHPDGYNIGMNCFHAAGQTVFHAHVHLIPRYQGDHPNPRGGVRAVIPGKQGY